MCSRSAASLKDWLCVIDNEMKGLIENIPEEGTGIVRKEFASLVSEVNVATGDYLLVVNLADCHKFTVLVVGNRASLLHSNNDDWSLGPPRRKFTLWEHIVSPVKPEYMNMSPDELRIFCEDLSSVVSNDDQHEHMCEKLFGIKWKRQKQKPYWFALLPLKPVKDLE